MPQASPLTNYLSLSNVTAASTAQFRQCHYFDSQKNNLLGTAGGRKVESLTRPELSTHSESFQLLPKAPPSCFRAFS